jgi:tRNA(fMet)-specific endonuclease VapC
MFVILDTNHYRELLLRTPAGLLLTDRLEAVGADAFTTVITVQEVVQGWLAEINRKTPGDAQIESYRQFQDAVSDFALITVLRFDAEAAAQFHDLRAKRLRTGTMDLKIAAIALSHEALLLSRNLRDFNSVPDLRVENWLD